MNPIYLLALIPLMAPLIVLYVTGRFTVENLPVAAATMFGGVLLTCLTALAFTSYTPKDTQVLNGFITTKEIHRFDCPINTSNPCRNGYDCNCHMVSYDCSTTDSKGNRVSQTCWREECDTCYKYSWERDFYLDSSLQGNRAYQISRVDPQGSTIPPRWGVVKHGDPVCITGSYENIIARAADSLFAQDGQAEIKYQSKIPTYPLVIYDYYKMDRLITVGNVRLDKRRWNEEISLALVQMGARKQANLVIIVAENVGMDYANAVRRAWKGFKKNDIVVFVGVDTAGNFQWTRTMSWSKTSLVNVQIDTEVREAFEGKPLEPLHFVALVKEATLASFVRRPMEDFAYLKAEYSLTTGQTICIWIICLLLTTGGVVLVVNTSGGMPTRDDFSFANLRSLDQLRNMRKSRFNTSNIRPPRPRGFR